MTRAASKIIRPNGLPTRVRVGACSGKVFAGVVGMDSPRFRIFGDTVNTAARMATNNDQEFYVHVTESTFKQLSTADLNWLYGVQGICVSKRGNGIQVKGKGKMQTYYLLNPMHSYQARKWFAPSCLQGMVEGVVSDLVAKVAKGVPHYRPPPVVSPTSPTCSSLRPVHCTVNVFLTLGQGLITFSYSILPLACFVKCIFLLNS